MSKITNNTELNCKKCEKAFMIYNGYRKDRRLDELCLKKYKGK